MADHPPDFDLISEPLEVRLSSGFAKIGGALKARAWKGALPARITPTQAQALVLLAAARGGVRLGALAQAMAVSAPTASDALGSLVGKALVIREADAADRRAVSFRLTPAGEALARETSGWPDFLAHAVATLRPHEQASLHRGMIKTIRALQDAGDIPVQRLCVTCRYFQPYAHPENIDRPHVCGFVGAPFGDRHLRLDCQEQEPASPGDQAALWRRFDQTASQEFPR